MSDRDSEPGTILRISGPVVGVMGMEHVRLYDVARVGELELIGEVIRLDGDLATVQIYEETSGLSAGEGARNTGRPLGVRLGPGMLGEVYDGLQRPLSALATADQYFIGRGVHAEPLNAEQRWQFAPLLAHGDRVNPGDVIGTVPESETVDHRVLVPAGVTGRVADINTGLATIDDVVATVESDDGKTHDITLTQQWPVRKPRPFRERRDPHEPLITGTRIIDAFFPVAKGGTAIIPGGFGTGKTVLQHALARWSDIDVVVYVGCGERGNEMAEVLEEFPNLSDPRTGAPLLNRTVLIANTSNMPVAAREASIFTGITIAEYYRDMGYDVLLLADSTSRWGEALREISGRLEEMPGEEGYPAYLAARIAEFYERAGRVTPLGDGDSARTGSVTVVGAVSPPGGDFSEPMTQASMRVAGTFWALDYELSRRRHFPAINWTRSYSLYDFEEWFARHLTPKWNRHTRNAQVLLQREEELQEIVQLVGPDALSTTDQATLFAARMLREDFLQQSAFDPTDRFCPLEKTFGMLRVIMTFSERMQRALGAGVALSTMTGLPEVQEIARMREIPADDAAEELQKLYDGVETRFEAM